MKSLQALNQPGAIELLEIDIANDDSVHAAAQKVESLHGRLDALVNNAAHNGLDGANTAEKLRNCLPTNVVAPVVVGDAFEPLLKKSVGRPRILNISSITGSIDHRLDKTSWFYNETQASAYRISKAALNMVSADQSVRYAEAGIKVFAYCPGFTISNFSYANTAEYGARPTSESVAPMLKVLNGERDAENGGFLHDAGQHPW